jgi:hypothetical protein
MKKIPLVSYFILAILLLGMVAGYVLGERLGKEWLKDLSLNGGTEILGILLTVLLIDAVIKRNEERERSRVRLAAYQQLRIPLIHQFMALHAMFKACIPIPPEKKATEVRDLFNDDYFVQIAFLDFSKPAPIASIQPLQWYDYLSLESRKFRAALGRTIEKYAVFLDVETIELLERLLDSSFLNILEQAPGSRDYDKKQGYKRAQNLLSGQGMSQLIRSYTSDYSGLVDAFNRIVQDDKKIVIDEDFWWDNVAPKYGSARVGS